MNETELSVMAQAEEQARRDAENMSAEAQASREIELMRYVREWARDAYRMAEARS